MKGILLTKGDAFNAAVTDIDEAQLPEGDVTVKTGKGNVTLDVKGDASVKAGDNVNVEGKEINIKCQTAVNIG